MRLWCGLGGDDVVEVVLEDERQQRLRQSSDDFVGERIKGEMRVTCQ